MKLKQYTWNIYEIAKANHAQTDVARDMFIANLNQGTDTYKGAKLDYKTLGALWKGMSIGAQHREKVQFNRMVREHMKALSKAWQAKDRAAFEAVLAGIKE